MYCLSVGSHDDKKHYYYCDDRASMKYLGAILSVTNRQLELSVTKVTPQGRFIKKGPYKL